MMEVRVEDCLVRGSSSDLVSVLQNEGLTSITLTRLDQLVSKELRGSGFSRVLVVLKSLQILSENRDDLQTLIRHGLTVKVVFWFKAVHDLLTVDFQKNSPPLLSLTEEFYDYFQLLGQADLPVSQLSVVLLQLAQFALEPEIHFPLRLEAIRTFNSILESLSREQRRLIQIDQNQTPLLSQVAEAVLTVGDYELQVSLSEALCRLTPRKDRQQRANRWFSSRDISSAFCDIRDEDFEVDCRRFLNFVNRNHGDQKRVYTFPCARAFLDSTELFPPKDDKLDEFWIDFNVGSECVSFFIDEPQGFLWESIHLQKDNVDHYSLQLKHDECTGAEVVLRVRMINPIMHHSSRGQTVELNFKREHLEHLEEAAGRVLMKVDMSSLSKDPNVLVQMCQSGEPFHSSKRAQLKVLPLSSPSSEEDSPVTKMFVSRAEVLFDQIRHSTPSYDSGVMLGAELEVSDDQREEFGGKISPIKKEVSRCDRKRTSPGSVERYLLDQTDGLLAHKRRARSQPEGEESNSPLTESLPEGAEPPVEEKGQRNEGVEPPQEKGQCGEGEVPYVEEDRPVLEAVSNLTSDITVAFNTFKTQLEQHFTGCWKTVENQILLSLKETQQQVSSLLRAVHLHRLTLLQQFQNSVSDQLNQLHQNSSSLNSINTQIQSFFQSEMQRLGSFCDEHLQRLKSLESGESSTSISPANEGGGGMSSSNQEEAQ